MVDKQSKEKLHDEGIIVNTTLDILREGAKKVLYEFTESIFDMDGEPREGDIEPGDTVLFIESIPTAPARIVAVKIIRDFWYLNTTSETPKGGYPSGRDAMKAADLDHHNLEILERFLIEKRGREHVRDVEEWKPDLKGEAVDVLDILKQATKKWHH